MIVVTMGGVTLGLAVLIHHLVDWWPGVKALKGKKKLTYVGNLLPFVIGSAYGALGVLTGMGLIGWAFDTALWAANWLGDISLWLGVGERVGQAAGGAYRPLTAAGNCLTLLLTVAVVGAARKTVYGPSIKRGVVCGLCLGTSTNIASWIALPLAEGVNALGTFVYGVV